MTDDAPTPETAAETPAPEATEQEQRTFTQQQVNDLLARQKGDVQRRYSDYDDLKQKALELEEIEEAKRSDLERLTNERDSLKESLTPLQTENLRLRVALEKKLPGDLIDRLKGGTEEEMQADADKLLELIGGEVAEPSLDGGARSQAQVQKKPEDAHNDFLSAVLARPDQ